MLTSLPLNWLRAFEAAARHGSFAAAALELNVTPSAVSQQIRALELRLSKNLFDRHANGVTPTAAGKRYAEELGRGFTLIDEATARLAEKRSSRELLVVHVATSFASQWIAPRLDLFRASHPGIELRLTALGHGVEAGRGKADAEIRYGWGDWPRLEATALMREEVFPVCAPSLAASLRTLADLKGGDLLHVPGYVEDWDAWLAFVGVAGIDTGDGTSFDQSIMAIRAAVEGKGIMLGRSALVERELATGLLVAPFSPRLQSSGAYWFLASPQRAAMHKVRAFRAWLLEVISNEGAVAPQTGNYDLRIDGWNQSRI
jgi:DNA-binding transcriptional LysR family regulator